MKIKSLQISIILLLLSQVLWSQTKVYFQNFETINLHKDYEISASKLFHSYLLHKNDFAIFYQNNQNDNQNLEFIKSEAQKNNCDHFIKGELNALGNLIIVSVSLYNTESSELIWSDVLKAKQVDDLDPVLQRLAKALVNKEKANLDSDIYDISEYESQELTRIQANTNFGLLIGGAYTLLKDAKSNNSEGFGAIVSWDVRDLILEAHGELYFNDINHYLISIDALYPFYNKRNTPFVGAALGFSGVTALFNKKNNYNYYNDYYYIHSYSSGGLLFKLHAGYLFNRNSNVSLRATISPFVDLYKVNGLIPCGVMINLALLFD